MCGLVGVFGEDLYGNEEEFFKDGLICSQLRGQDSTGAAVVYGPNYSVKVLKGAYDSTLFVAKDDVKKLIEKSRQSRVFLGHTRFATHGSVVDENAHPFTHEHITLAHNGGINNKGQLPDGEKFKVDSEAICHSIAKIGAIETLKLVNGAFALTYIDSELDKFNIIRNSGRTLYMTKNKNKRVWYYMSEGEMLFALLRRNRIDFGEIEPVMESHLYSYDFKEKSLEIKKVDYSRDWYQDQQRQKWKNYGREADTEESLGGTTQPSPTTNASSAPSVVTTEKLEFKPEVVKPSNQNRMPLTSCSTFSHGYDGTGFQHLEKWGLSLGSYVCVYILEAEFMNKALKSMKAFGVWGPKVCPKSDLVIAGFSEELWKKVQNKHGRYFTQIKQCFWGASAKQYTIMCQGLWDVPPKGARIVVPILKDEPKAPLIIAAPKKDVIPALPKKIKDSITPMSDVREEIDPKSVTESDLQALTDYNASEIQRMNERVRDDDERMEDEMVFGGAQRGKIVWKYWMKLTDDGCNYCGGILTYKTTTWFGEQPVHTDCLKELNDYNAGNPVKH